MKHGVYLGSLVKVLHVTDKTATIDDDGDIYHIGKHLVKEVDEQKYKEVEEELEDAKNETKQIITRMGKLIEAYAEKSNALSSLLMKSRQKELSIISKLVKKSHVNCQKESSDVYNENKKGAD